MTAGRVGLKAGLTLAAAFLLAFSLQAQNTAVRPDYAPVSAALELQIKQQMAEKQLPALAIVLVDDQSTVWAQGFGYEDVAHQHLATAHTIFRIGSVSQLFTDIAIMQMVGRGSLQLDKPVQTYVPEFHPANPFASAITLRELMAHRAGLVREPPVGHYFDNASPSLEATVASLNQTTLVVKPGTHTKYSNAGASTVGFVLERVAKQPFADYVKQSVLAPLNMRESAFAPPPATAHMAQGRMWSYDGLDFAAPTFTLGEAPAEGMYSSVSDLGIFLSALFAEGHGQSGQVVTAKSLGMMWQPESGGSVGLGFQHGSLDGHGEVASIGAIYGFATQLAALPDDKLGVVVITTIDQANAAVNQIAETALQDMLALRAKRPLPRLAVHPPVGAEDARQLEADYTATDGKLARLEESRGGLALFRGSGMIADLRRSKDGLIQDSRLVYSHEPLTTENSLLRLSGRQYRRTSGEIPPAAQNEWNELIGEYGWDHNKLYVLEDGGKLNILAKWFDFESLEQSAKDVFQLPSSGPYDSETVTFLRDSSGAVTGVKVGTVVFKKLPLPAAGEVFHIEPRKPVAELRREALASHPPVEQGTFRKPDLVQLNEVDPTVKLEIRYATKRNFLGSPVYLQPRAYMQRPAAESLVRASHALHTLGYGLLIHDSYRPWYVTKMFWDGTPDDKRIFVAKPWEGSRHNRGCAVDLTLYDIKTGLPALMPGGYDEMSERSYPFYPGGTARQRWLRNLLRRAMEAQGFTVNEVEWWHFDYKDWSKYPILNLTFEQLEKQTP